MIRLFFSAVLFSFIILSGCRNKTAFFKKQENVYKGNIIFVCTYNMACECQQEKSQKIDAFLENIFSGKRNLMEKINFKRIDYYSNLDEVHGYMSKYKIFMPPFVVLTDSSNDVIYKNEKEFEEDKFIIAFNKLLKNKI